LLCVPLSSATLCSYTTLFRSVNVSGLLRDFVNAAETYIDDYTVARKSEIIAFEMAKEIMWDIRTVSDLGQEQMKVVGSNSITVVDRKSTRLNSSHVKISYAVF